MATVLMATPDPKRFRHLSAALTREGNLSLKWAASGASALETAARQAPAVALVDETLPDMDGLDLVKRLLSVSAWIQTVVASGLPPEVFHEKSEGLGVTAQCALEPDPSEAEAVAAVIRQAAGA